MTSPNRIFAVIFAFDKKDPQESIKNQFLETEKKKEVHVPRGNFFWALSDAEKFAGKKPHLLLTLRVSDKNMDYLFNCKDLELKFKDFLVRIDLGK